jgi:hypothetical protein
LHTLYHELNNPLNALLSLAGDVNQFISSDISNSRIENKSAILIKKTNRQKKNQLIMHIVIIIIIKRKKILNYFL